MRWSGASLENPPNDVEPVRAARMGHARLGGVFGRKFRQRLGVDIGRIGQNEIVARDFKRREQIAFDQPHAIGKPVLFDIAPGDGERVGRKVRRVDARVGKDARGEDRDRAPARAEVENAGDVLRIAGQPVVLGEGRDQQFADEAARRDDALVDVERHAPDIGAVQEVGRGLPRGHPRLDQRVEPLALAAQELRVEKRVERIDREVQALEDEIRGFVERGRRAVAEGEARGAEAADGVAQPVARGRKQFEALVGLGQGHPPGSKTAGTLFGRPLHASEAFTRRACTRA